MMDNLIWVDIETTGLDHTRNHILEVAVVVTDSELIMIDSLVVQVNQPTYVMNFMDDWCREQHTRSGLLADVIEHGEDEWVAERILMAFMKDYAASGTSPMCGNSICFDRRFLHHHMPSFECMFHYRNLDVSSLKICSQLWAPEYAASVEKNGDHRALDDVLESIAELKYYKEHMLKV